MTTVTNLEPSVSVNSSANYNYQTYTGAGGLPENSFEDTLSSISGTTNLLAFMGSDGLAFANAQDPSMGGTVVSTAISNLGSPVFSYGPGFAGPASGGYGGYGYGGYQSVPLAGGAGFPGALYNTGAFGSIGGSGTGTYGNTTDGFSPGNVKQSILDEGLQQILLMAEVQQAARTLDAMSNILKTQHDANMNSIRNLRS